MDVMGWDGILLGKHPTKGFGLDQFLRCLGVLYTLLHAPSFAVRYS